MRDSGKLFQSICHTEKLDLLISHYHVLVICTNVMKNAFYLKKISEHAKIYF